MVRIYNEDNREVGPKPIWPSLYCSLKRVPCFKVKQNQIMEQHAWIFEAGVVWIPPDANGSMMNMESHRDNSFIIVCANMTLLYIVSDGKQ